MVKPGDSDINTSYAQVTKDGGVATGPQVESYLRDDCHRRRLGSHPHHRLDASVCTGFPGPTTLALIHKGHALNANTNTTQSALL